MRRDDRHVVAVVLGGASAGARDARMRQLLEAQHRRGLGHARPRPRSPKRPMRPRAAAPKLALTSRARRRAARRVDRTAAGAPSRIEAPGNGRDRRSPRRAPPSDRPSRSGRSWWHRCGEAAGAAPAHGRRSRQVSPAPAASSRRPRTCRPGVPVRASASRRSLRASRCASAAAWRRARRRRATRRSPSAHPDAASNARGDGSSRSAPFRRNRSAASVCTAAQERRARLLAPRRAVHRAGATGETTLYRARFAGFDRDQAEAACKYLKRNESIAWP